MPADSLIRNIREVDIFYVANMAACIGTWSFSHTAVVRAQQLLSANTTSLDTVEEAIARICPDLSAVSCHSNPICRSSK